MSAFGGKADMAMALRNVRSTKAAEAPMRKRLAMAKLDIPNSANRSRDASHHV